MRLRRGLLFAAIHMAITVGLVYWQEAPFWDYIPIVPTAQRTAPHDITAQLGVNEGDTAADSDYQDRPPQNPCQAADVSDRPTSSQERILEIDNLPIALITGWHLPCSPPSRLDRQIQVWYGFTQESESVTGRVIAILALVLWFVVGGFPMIRRRHRRWYTEPGLFMTLSTLLAVLLLGIGWSISHIDSDLATNISDGVIRIAVFPMLFVAIGWIWWVGLFFYTRWKMTRRWLNRRAVAAQ